MWALWCSKCEKYFTHSLTLFHFHPGDGFLFAPKLGNSPSPQGFNLLHTVKFTLDKSLPHTHTHLHLRECAIFMFRIMTMEESMWNYLSHTSCCHRWEIPLKCQSRGKRVSPCVFPRLCAIFFCCVEKHRCETDQLVTSYTPASTPVIGAGDGAYGWRFPTWQVPTVCVHYHPHVLRVAALYPLMHYRK